MILIVAYITLFLKKVKNRFLISVVFLIAIVLLNFLQVNAFIKLLNHCNDCVVESATGINFSRDENQLGITIIDANGVYTYSGMTETIATIILLIRSIICNKKENNKLIVSYIVSTTILIIITLLVGIYGSVILLMM